MNFLETCHQFIAIDTTPAAGTLELARWIEARSKALGFHAELQIESWNGLEQANVLVRPQLERPVQEVIFQTHLDTPDPGAFGLWTKTGANPFNGTVFRQGNDSLLYGLGAADTKLDFVCKLEALHRLTQAHPGLVWSTPPVLVGTYGEESGMPGAISLIRKKKVNARQALVGEPTALRLVTAGKGFASVEIGVPFSDEEREFREAHDQGLSSSSQSKVFVGRASHSSHPELGDSAYVKLMEYLQRLPEGVAVLTLEAGVNFNTVPANAVLEIDTAGLLRDPVAGKLNRIWKAIRKLESEFLTFRDEAFNPPYATLNLGMARTFDDRIQLSGCVRLPPRVPQETYDSWINDVRRAVEREGATLRINDTKRPFSTPLDDRLVELCQQALRDMGRPDSTEVQSVANEANVFSRFGIATVVMGPGQGVGNSHTPEECVSLTQLEASVEFYERAMRLICVG